MPSKSLIKYPVILAALAGAFALSPLSTLAAGNETPWPGGTWTPSPEQYRAGLERNVQVRMSDGVILTVDVSYPVDFLTDRRAGGKFPVILTQSPYVKQNPKDGDYFVKRGYIYVTAHVRGTTTSEGQFGFMSERDAKDGAELVKWAAGVLPGSNGIVGLHGGSYMGLTQMHTVAELGPGSPVKAMQASCMGAEFYRETYFSGGVPTQTLNFQKRTLDAMGTKLAGDAGMDNYREIMRGGDKAYSRSYWQERSVINILPAVMKADVPTLIWSSSGDIYAQSSLELYAYMQNAAARRPIYGPMSPDVQPSGRYQVIISQGGHCKNQDPRIQLEWFDTWLKGQKTGMTDTKVPIHIHELGSDRWLNTSHFPVVSDYSRRYLNSEGGLSAAAPVTPGKEQLRWEQPSPESTVRYTSSVFTKGASLAGPISASIYASSSTRNLMLIATLEKIEGDGSSSLISSGSVLGSLSENDADKSWHDKNGVPTRPYGIYEKDSYLKPDEIKKFDFSLSSRFVHLNPGSRLRVTFTTQVPVASCSPSLGTDPCFPTQPQQNSLKGSVVTLYHGPSAPSSINLPLLEANCWRSSDNAGVPFWNADPKLKKVGEACQL